MNTEERIQRILQNPHFESISEILRENGIAENLFMEDFRQLLENLLEEHQDDNPSLAEESHWYILPAIAVYKTLKKYTDSALDLFRRMWLHGAEKGSAFLQKKAEDESFLAGWCRNVTPKNPDGGAFVFDIRESRDEYTEYHVLKCPYVSFCREYGCREIVTVFCDSDDISFGNIHSRLRWGRTKTIGRGDEICDFRYTYIRPSEQ